MKSWTKLILVQKSPIYTRFCRNIFAIELINSYKVENRGPSDIEEAEVYILWPSFRATDDPLLYLTAQPQIEGPGVCQYVSDVNTHNIKVS